MKGDTFALEQTQPDFVWLVFAVGGTSTRVALYLPREFTVDDACEALLVTGHVQQTSDGNFCLISDVPHRELCSLIEEMLGYFRAPGAASEQLLSVMAAVNEYDPALAAAQIPLLAYAWLDVVVRDDIADQARSASDIWLQRQITIECQVACARRVDELRVRWAARERSIGRMAPSVATRPRGASDERTG